MQSSGAQANAAVLPVEMAACTMSFELSQRPGTATQAGSFALLVVLLAAASRHDNVAHETCVCEAKLVSQVRKGGIIGAQAFGAGNHGLARSLLALRAPVSATVSHPSSMRALLAAVSQHVLPGRDLVSVRTLAWTMFLYRRYLAPGPFSASFGGVK